MAEKKKDKSLGAQIKDAKKSFEDINEKIFELIDQAVATGQRQNMSSVIDNLEMKLRDRMYRMGGSYNCSSKPYLEPIKQEARFLEKLIEEFKRWETNLPKGV